MTTVRPATKNDLPAVADLLAATFVEDPSLGWVVRKAPDPEAILREYFMVLIDNVYVPSGRIDVVDLDGEIGGVALWKAPGVQIPKWVTARKVAILAKAGRAVPDILRYVSGTDHSYLAFKHWYLHTVAVSANARGTGIGGALLDHGLSQTGNYPVYLEATSKRAARLYQKKGFVALGEIGIPGPGYEIAMCKPQIDLMDEE